ncbi:hypothetical protein L423_00573 [Enterobacter roggenkampii]|nr:hypothetical protein L423_00573 [Enterobacter roggenkampii]
MRKNRIIFLRKYNLSAFFKAIEWYHSIAFPIMKLILLKNPYSLNNLI